MILRVMYSQRLNQQALQVVRGASAPSSSLARRSAGSCSRSSSEKRTDRGACEGLDLSAGAPTRVSVGCSTGTSFSPPQRCYQLAYPPWLTSTAAVVAVISLQPQGWVGRGVDPDAGSTASTLPLCITAAAVHSAAVHRLLVYLCGESNRWCRRGLWGSQAGAGVVPVARGSRPSDPVREIERGGSTAAQAHHLRRRVQFWELCAQRRWCVTVTGALSSTGSLWVQQSLATLKLHRRSAQKRSLSVCVHPALSSVCHCPQLQWQRPNSADSGIVRVNLRWRTISPCVNTRPQPFSQRAAPETTPGVHIMHISPFPLVGGLHHVLVHRWKVNFWSHLHRWRQSVLPERLQHGACPQSYHTASAPGAASGAGSPDSDRGQQRWWPQVGSSVTVAVIEQAAAARCKGAAAGTSHRPSALSLSALSSSCC
jgi:hypothetical protein